MTTDEILAALKRAESALVYAGAEIPRLQALNNQLADALKRVEFVDTYESHRMNEPRSCPRCGGFEHDGRTQKAGHSEACRIAEALAAHGKV